MPRPFGIDNCPGQVVPKLTYLLGAIGVPPGTGGIHVSLCLVILIAGSDHSRVFGC